MTARGSPGPSQPSGALVARKLLVLPRNSCRASWLLLRMSCKPCKLALAGSPAGEPRKQASAPQPPRRRRSSRLGRPGRQTGDTQQPARHAPAVRAGGDVQGKGAKGISCVHADEPVRPAPQPSHRLLPAASLLALASAEPPEKEDTVSAAARVRTGRFACSPGTSHHRGRGRGAELRLVLVPPPSRSGSGGSEARGGREGERRREQSHQAGAGAIAPFSSTLTGARRREADRSEVAR
ncbi:hypothetical protein PAHAL_2G348900 [Panicum hallii]|uniref:Uncharacterized protein n=1 Tax=Panicum hallii TaxID=206008 RepID=A0A2T8KRC6_9POAL|nr:hypothetical protein PAHAL_2G348900 [Panicum hallii]